MSDHFKNKCVLFPNNIKCAIESRSRASSVMKIGAINKDILQNKSPSVPETISDDDDDGNGISSDSRPQSSANTSKSVGTFLSDGNLDGFVDSINKLEEEIWDLLATACFASNTPINFTENMHWQKLFKRIKPSLQLPSTHQLSNLLLNKQYSQIRSLVYEKIANAKTIGIQIDGWSNIRNKLIINIIITILEPLFLKVIDCKNNRDDA